MSMGSKLAGENALETYGGAEGFHKPVGGRRRMSDLIGSLCVRRVTRGHCLLQRLHGQPREQGLVGQERAAVLPPQVTENTATCCAPRSGMQESGRKAYFGERRGKAPRPPHNKKPREPQLFAYLGPGRVAPSCGHSTPLPCRSTCNGQSGRSVVRTAEFPRKSPQTRDTQAAMRYHPVGNLEMILKSDTIWN